MSDTDYKKSAGTQSGGQPESRDLQPVNRRTEGETNMSDTNFEKTVGTQDGGQPKPWDRQPGEPEDRYYWFRLYLTQPIPRKVAQVAKLIGTNSKRTYLSKIAREWRWEERAVHFDADKAEQLVIQAEMREQLLFDKLFEVQFHGLLDTTQAIENAEIDRMDRDEARGHLSQIARHQRGLLSFILQQNEQAAGRSQQELDEARLAQEVEEEALAMIAEEEARTDEQLMQIYGGDEESAETCGDSEEDG
ncbi:MAG: hypothetical protein OXF50_08755 [Caldilineaceae bacterium]|nr:hypothetical protein [Caldilineaceae bacterium]